jgi:hypothetical protein
VKNGTKEAKQPQTADSARRHYDRMWQLYLRAFDGLIDRYPLLPPELYDQEGDREFESAQEIARAALLLAICACAQFENYETRIAEFNKEIAPP